MEREVTFAGDAAAEELVLEWVRRARRDDRLVLVQVPQYGDPKAIFSFGWTLVEGKAEEVLTHQCVVFLAGDPFPLCRSDGGVICVALQKDLSAWNGLTGDQTLATAA